MNGTLKRSKWMIAICLVVILVCGIVANCVKTRGGDYIVREVTISPYGSDLSFTMYIPKAAFDTDENGNFVISGCHRKRRLYRGPLLHEQRGAGAGAARLCGGPV